MRKKEIKRTREIEEVVSVQYIAEDGTVFSNEDECKKYEDSALFAANSKLKRLTTEITSQYAFNDAYSEDQDLEIFDVQTEEDLENLRRYLYQKAIKNGSSEQYIKSAFTSENGCRKDYVFDNVTIGHEVLIFWGYENDWFWVYGDGSVDGYCKWVREQYIKIIAPKENKNADGGEN